MEGAKEILKRLQFAGSDADIIVLAIPGCLDVDVFDGLVLQLYSRSSGDMLGVLIRTGYIARVGVKAARMMMTREKDAQVRRVWTALSNETRFEILRYGKMNQMLEDAGCDLLFVSGANAHSVIHRFALIDRTPTSFIAWYLKRHPTYVETPARIPFSAHPIVATPTEMLLSLIKPHDSAFRATLERFNKHNKRQSISAMTVLVRAAHPRLGEDSPASIIASDCALLRYIAQLIAGTNKSEVL
jgi:hypothetical protein